MGYSWASLSCPWDTDACNPWFGAQGYSNIIWLNANTCITPNIIISGQSKNRDVLSGLTGWPWSGLCTGMDVSHSRGSSGASDSHWHSTAMSWENFTSALSKFCFGMPPYFSNISLISAIVWSISFAFLPLSPEPIRKSLPQSFWNLHGFWTRRDRFPARFPYWVYHW